MFANNLPRQSTTFVGRRKELDEIAGLLSDVECRLLTLVGPGGSGKSRLAMQAALENASRFAYGAYFVSLLPLRTPAGLAPLILDTLNVRPDGRRDPADQLIDYLKEKEILLIMDNFEHLLEGVGLVTDLLAGARCLKVIATSREPLALQEEWVRHISGMRFPEHAGVEAIESYSAVQLFCERAQRVKGNFSFANERQHVARILQSVEGMPLAIELAASWVNTLSCQAVADEIQRNMDLLATHKRDVPERHRSIRAVFNESWRLLKADEQDIFRKLSVFRGSFRRESAIKITGASLFVLSSLVEKCLICMTGDDIYAMHSLLVQYAQEKLDADAVQEAYIKDMHSDYYAGFLQVREEDLKGKQQRIAVDEITAEFENVAAAWEWAIIHRRASVVDRCMEAFFIYLSISGRQNTGEKFFEQARQAFNPYEALASSSGDTHEGDDASADREKQQPSLTWARLGLRMFKPQDELPPLKHQIEELTEFVRQQGAMFECARGLILLSNIYKAPHEHEKALSLMKEALEICEEAGLGYYTAGIYDQLAMQYIKVGQVELCIQMTRRALEVHRRVGDVAGVPSTLNNLGAWAERECRYAEAERYYQEAVNAHIEFGTLGGEAFSGLNLGMMAFYNGDFSKTRTMAEKYLRIAIDINHSGSRGYALILLAALAFVEGNYQSALRLLQESRPFVRNNSDLIFTYDWVNAMVSCGLEDYAAARASLYPAFEHAIRTAGYSYQMLCLPFVAVVLDEEGETQLAAEMLGLLFNHNLSPRRCFENIPYITDFKNHLQQKLDQEIFERSCQCCGDEDLERVSKEVMDILKPDIDEETSVTEGVQCSFPSQLPALQTHRTVQAASNAEIVEPLSERELEVLELLSVGKSNREIARILVIALGTTKTHIHNIFGKLGVTSRTQAIARARELGLVTK